MKKLIICINHQNLIRFEQLALEIAEGIESHCQFEININPEKTQAVVNIQLINFKPSLFCVDPGKFEELRMRALDLAKASNSGIKIVIRVDKEKTRAEADILLLGVTK